jgi:hypothetical protein
MFRDGPESVQSRLKETTQSARSALARGYQQTGRLVEQHPGSALLLSFGAGFGLGLLIATILSDGDRPRRRDWDVADYLRGIPEQLRHLPQTLARHVPDSIARHI